jgi:Na+-driven multidrug efflux pump
LATNVPIVVLKIAYSPGSRAGVVAAGAEVLLVAGAVVSFFAGAGVVCANALRAIRKRVDSRFISICLRKGP